MSKAPGTQLVTKIPSIPRRDDEAQKGDFGRALIIAGSRGMSGAACLSGTSALRSGAGLVTVAVPSGILNIVACYEPSYMTLPLSEDESGKIHQSALQQLASILPRQTALGVGPGLGQSASLQELVSELYNTATQPAVFDADALNLLAKRSFLLKRKEDAPARILTPHPGEFSRLTGLSIETIQENRTQHAAEFAKAKQLIVVLKGKNTVITDGTRVAINATGNSGMATGGTGDVLTGLITALLAQGLSAFDAAHLGVHVHGTAGDLAAIDPAKPGLIASDLLRSLAQAWSRID